MTATITAVLGMLLGGGIIGFIQFLITRSDNKDEKQQEILDKLEDNKQQINNVQEQTQKELQKIWQFIKKGDAKTMRTHILRFYDEIAEQKQHGKEYFDQIIDEIAEYEKYCTTHPDFPNGRTVHAAAYIRKTYEKLVEKGKFAERKK